MTHSSNPPTIKSTLLLIAFILSLLSPDIPRASAKAAFSPHSVTRPGPARVAAVSQNAPVMFIENVGQFDAKERFQVRGAGGAIHLASDAMWVTLLEPPSTSDVIGGQLIDLVDSAQLDTPRAGVNLRLSFVGANPNPQMEGFDPLDTHVSYFTGSDPSQWRTDVPAWAGVRYVDLYPGIDLEITGENG